MILLKVILYLINDYFFKIMIHIITCGIVPGGSDGKNPSAMLEPGFDPESGRSPEGNGN